MSKQREMFVYLAIVLVFLGAAVVFYLFSPAASERRGKDSMSAYILETGIKPTRKSCVYDSDGDGYSSCTVVNGDEVIQLQCSSGLFNTLPLIGSKSCKEQFNQVLKLNKGS